jgi:hypothetical protein
VVRAADSYRSKLFAEALLLAADLALHALVRGLFDQICDQSSSGTARTRGSRIGPERTALTYVPAPAAGYTTARPSDKFLADLLAWRQGVAERLCGQGSEPDDASFKRGLPPREKMCAV